MFIRANVWVIEIYELFIPFSFFVFCWFWPMNAGFISSFVFCHFWQRSYQNQLSFSGKDSTTDFFCFSSFTKNVIYEKRHLRKTKVGWNAQKLRKCLFTFFKSLACLALQTETIIKKITQPKLPKTKLPIYVLSQAYDSDEQDII